MIIIQYVYLELNIVKRCYVNDDPLPKPRYDELYLLHLQVIPSYTCSAKDVGFKNIQWFNFCGGKTIFMRY